MEEWKEYRLREVCDLIPGFAFKSGDFGNYTTKVIKIKDIIPPFVYLNEADGVNLKNYDANRLSKFIVKKDDFILAMTGATIGKIGRYVDETQAYLNQRVLKFLPKDNVDSKYIYYSLITQMFKLYVVNHIDSESAQPNISANTIGNYPILLPSLNTQRKISAILKSLDDKIENNRKIIENLEEQAQALFKSWFVDFEPFRDQPFVDSELGPIPQGWRVVTLDEACKKITDGSHYSPKDNTNGVIPMLSVKDMGHNDFDYSSCKRIDEEEFNKMKKNDCVPLIDDILVAKDGSYLKEIFICNDETPKAVLSSIAIFRSNPNVIYPELLLQLLRLPLVKKNVGDNYVSGSALPRIVLKDFKKFKFVVAPIDVQNLIIELFKALQDQIFKNELEIRNLATLRDTLLPKLMSGEIKV